MKNQKPESDEGGEDQKLRGFTVPTYQGKVIPYKQRDLPTEKEIRSIEVTELIEALIDAARKIGELGNIGDYSNCNFHLHPRHLVDLIPPDHPKLQHLLEMPHDSWARLVVQWPRRESLELPSENEFREKPMEIVGALMRRILDGDTAFFDELAEQLRSAKSLAKKAGSNGEILNKVGKVAAELPDYGLNGDSVQDWFTRLEHPQKGVPLEIWLFCESLHQNSQEPPTRREIRDHLESKRLFS